MPGFMEDLVQVLGKIGSELNPSYGPQVAQNMSDNNPYRPVLNRASWMGVPTLNAIESAANWESQQRNTALAEQQHQLQEQQFAANTVNVTPEMVQLFQGYSPDNLNAHLPLTGTRYLNDLTAINTREEALRSRDKTKAAQASILNGLTQYFPQLQSTPQGALTLGALQNPDAFTSEQWGGYYHNVPGIVQGGVNRDATSKALGGLVGSMPTGATKQMLQQLVPLTKLEGMEGMGTQIASSALGSVPKPLTEGDRLHNRLVQAQIDNIYADNNRADQKGQETQAQAAQKEAKIKPADIANRISASAASYRTYEDYIGDLERHRWELIPLIGVSAYNRLVADAPNIQGNVFGSKFVPVKQRKIKSGYITYLLSQLRKS